MCEECFNSMQLVSICSHVVWRHHPAFSKKRKKKTHSTQNISKLTELLIDVLSGMKYLLNVPIVVRYFFGNTQSSVIVIRINNFWLNKIISTTYVRISYCIKVTLLSNYHTYCVILNQDVNEFTFASLFFERFLPLFCHSFFSTLLSINNHTHMIHIL